MLFNSIEFALFLPVVFISYWFVFNKNLNTQNAFVLVASYFFYGWWDWRFLSLIAFSSVVDFVVGKCLSNQSNPTKRKMLLFVSIFINVGALGFFKYYNFFIDSFVDAFSIFGAKPDVYTLKIILPVGISFYTFQTLSYTIDVYRKKLKPTTNVIAFFTFVSFFPQLVAGPIERASNLLPQFYKNRVFDYSKAVDGMRQILWGLFKKVVIADNCAQFVNPVFNHYTDYSSPTLILGVFLFAFQIYCDFSGYSDIAIGTARLFGFSLMRNFAFPYFSRDIAEFWRRWHISLSTWFRDYVYIPLGGSKGNTLFKIRNVIIIFVVSGFWHGANWTFVVWGLLNGLYFIPMMLLKINRKNMGVTAENSILPSFKELIQIATTFTLTLIAWVFFRADSLHHALDYLKTILVGNPFAYKQISERYIFTLLFIVILVVVEWVQRDRQHGLEFIQPGNSFPVKLFRYSVYISLAILIIVAYPNVAVNFIYFQF